MNTTAAQALRILRAVCVTTGTALLVAAQFLHANRREILDTFAHGLLTIAAGVRWAWVRRHHVRDAALLTLLATLAAAAWCYQAGQATRRVVDAISRRSCALLPQQPLPAAAPITATLEAAREALARLVARLYPEPVLR